MSKIIYLFFAQTNFVAHYFFFFRNLFHFQVSVVRVRIRIIIYIFEIFSTKIINSHTKKTKKTQFYFRKSCNKSTNSRMRFSPTFMRFNSLKKTSLLIRQNKNVFPSSSPPMSIIMAAFSSSSSTQLFTGKTKPNLDPSLIILSNGFMNTPKSCLVRVGPHSGLLINCGEGTQRVYMHSLSKTSCTITNILLTKHDWSCIGGLHSFGKLTEEHALKVNSKSKIILHSPVYGHHTQDFTADLYRHLFFDNTFQVKQYDYEKNEGVFKLEDESSGEFTIKNICMKLNENDREEIPCFSYMFTFKSNKLPRLNIAALIKEVIICEYFDSWARRPE
jgi:hypothetical protein